MRNLALVINDNPVANHGIVQRTTVNRGAGANLHAIANNDATQLRDLYPVTAIVSVAEAIRANHRAGLNQAILADLNLMVNGHISPQTRAGAYFRIFPNEAACADNYVIAQHYAGFDNRVGADGNVATQLRRRIDDRARRDILSRLRRGIKNLSHARVGQVGVTHYQRGAMGKR